MDVLYSGINHNKMAESVNVGSLDKVRNPIFIVEVHFILRVQRRIASTLNPDKLKLRLISGDLLRRSPRSQGN